MELAFTINGKRHKTRLLRVEDAVLADKRCCSFAQKTQIVLLEDANLLRIFSTTSYFSTKVLELFYCQVIKKQ